MDLQVVPLTSRFLAKQKAGQCCLELLQLHLFAVGEQQKQVKISGLCTEEQRKGWTLLLIFLHTLYLIVPEYSLKEKFLCRSGCSGEAFLSPKHDLFDLEGNQTVQQTVLHRCEGVKVCECSVLNWLQSHGCKCQSGLVGACASVLMEL